MNHYPKTTGLTQSAIGNIEAGIRGYGASVVVIAHALKTDPGFLQMIDRGVRSITTPNTTALVGGSATPATIGQTLEALAATLSALDAGTRETVAGLIHEAICKPDKALANIAAIEALVRFATGRVETAAIAQAPAKT